VDCASSALWASFREKTPSQRVWQARASKFETRFGPQGAVKNELSSLLRDSVEATKAGNGKPEVASSAIGDSHICSQPGRRRKRIIGIRHRLEHFRRRSAGCRASLLAALGAGSARDSQCTPGFWEFLPEDLPNLAGSHGPGNPCRWLPLARPQVLPSPGEWQAAKVNCSTETYFYCVKSFSYSKTWL
jgi:hypothetical protein